MVALQYIGLIVLGVALFGLCAIGAGGSFNAMREPRKRGLLSRVVLGDPLHGLTELWRHDGLDGFLYGAHRH